MRKTGIHALNSRIIPWIVCALTVCVLVSGCGTSGAGTGTEAAAGSALSGSGQSTDRKTSEDLDPVSKQSFYFDTICQVTVYAIDEDIFLSSDAGKTWAASQNGESEAGGTDSADPTNDHSTGTADVLTADERFQKEAQAAISDVFSLCGQYEGMLSKTVEGSDIWNVNHAGGKAVTVNAETASIVDKGIQYGDLSDGRFDITIGKAEDLWDFHSDSPQVPDAAELAEAVQHVNYKTIHVDTKACTIQMDDPDAEIDLGGIAKGFIADEVCARLSADGVTAAIVSLGGNIECVGGKPDQNGFISREEADVREGNFRIGIETPYSHESRIVGSSPLNNGTMVTSGVYERYFEQDGVQYHHILDPDTGYPVETDVLGVTITSSEGRSADCDALSTICLILGSEEGMKLISSMDGYEAVFIKTDDSIVKTGGVDFTPVQ